MAIVSEGRALPLRHCALNILFLTLVCASGATSSQSGETAANEREGKRSSAVRTVNTVQNYRFSGDVAFSRADEHPGIKARWSPEQIVQLLQDFPDRYVAMGGWGGSPTGNARHREVGRVVDEVQALSKRLGVGEMSSRLMLGIRNDVFHKYRSGDPICTLCDEEGNCEDLCTWEGALEDAPFDPAWIATVPRSDHQWSVDRLWGGDPRKDPWSEQGAHLWPKWFDRVAVEVANTDHRVAALYGKVSDLDPSEERTDWAPRVSAVVMDLRNPEYRAWSVKRLIANLKWMGVDPGEAVGIPISYKPGWHAHYAGPDSGDRCYVVESHMWTGPAGPCDGARRPPGGPLYRTPYGPGEFEEALNLMLKEFRAGLVAAGYEEAGIITIERPRYKGQVWSILDREIREASWLIGELKTSCDRTDLTQPPDPNRCATE
jgi:hypothetical protein